MIMIDYLPLLSPTRAYAQGWSDEKRFQQELAKTNYLNIHKRRKRR